MMSVVARLSVFAAGAAMVVWVARAALRFRRAVNRTADAV